MPEETPETKEEKLAAARRKLKEYQKRNAEIALLESKNAEANSTPATGSISSNLSDRSDSEMNISNHGSIGEEASNDIINVSIGENRINFLDSFVTPTAITATLSNANNYFDMNPQEQAAPEKIKETNIHNLNAIQVLIAEKSQLTADLNKCRLTVREKDLQVETLGQQISSTTHRLEDMQKRFMAQQLSTEQFRNTNAELQHKLAQSNANNEDHKHHLQELQNQLNLLTKSNLELQQNYKGKCSDLEMAQIRIHQLSDENSSHDNRVETVPQTQFMYEQQIRDLQAMLQQLSQDKEQANVQYQNYAQHLNSEVSTLSGKNAQLMDECSKLQERERQLVDHIGALERDIQKNICRNDHQRNENTVSPEAASMLTTEIDSLKEKLSDYDMERHEFLLKIKSQEDRLEVLEKEFIQSENHVESLQKQLENIASEQPDKTKLLASMESNKVAASRAMSQNVELKTQLEEMETRFVQLTNDKAELMNKLDAELYANRELRTQASSMMESLRLNDERFNFKDEEMIRLSNENMELSQKNLLLQQQWVKLTRDDSADTAYDNSDCKLHEHNEGSTHSSCNDGNYLHDHEIISLLDNDCCQEAKEDEINQIEKSYIINETQHLVEPVLIKNETKQSVDENSSHIPTAEAVEKLQLRFTQLMSQIADLTEEKHRLEHLVLQLQDETETIGEYVTLYQTQRRILKQREYEKSAQMKLLEEEREKLRGQVTMLNKLVTSLGMVFPQNSKLKSNLSTFPMENDSWASTVRCDTDTTDTTTHDPINPQNAENNSMNYPLNASESHEILARIQTIITEIRENTKEVPTIKTVDTVDHLNCCLGKFEIV